MRMGIGLGLGTQQQTVNADIAAPSINALGSGQYTITGSSGSTIYYTKNGTTPSVGTQGTFTYVGTFYEYQGSITIKAIAVVGAETSPVATLTTSAYNTPLIFTVANADGSKYFKVKTSVTTTLTVTGNVYIGGSSNPSGSSMDITAGIETTVYFIGTSGTIVCNNISYITSLKVTGTGTSITGSINGMDLTYLYLTGVGTSITGSINGMALTTLSLNGTGTSITGSINGMDLTTLSLTGTGTSITGSINGMAITYLYLSGTGTSITGSITGMAITYLYLDGVGTSITGSINGMALTTIVLSGVGTSITGSINGMALTTLSLNGTGTSITGSITGMALTYLSLSGTGTAITKYGSIGLNVFPTVPNKEMMLTWVDNNKIDVAENNQATVPSLTLLTGGNNKSFGITVSGLDITVQLATDGSGNSTTTSAAIVSGWTEDAAAVASIALFGTGATIATDMSKTNFRRPFNTLVSMQILGTSTTTLAQYRGLLLQTAGALPVGNITFTITDNSADIIPDYDDDGDYDAMSNLQCKTAWLAIKAKGGTKSMPANWISEGYTVS